MTVKYEKGSSCTVGLPLPIYFFLATTPRPGLRTITGKGEARKLQVWSSGPAGEIHLDVTKKSDKPVPKSRGVLANLLRDQPKIYESLQIKCPQNAHKVHALNKRNPYAKDRVDRSRDPGFLAKNQELPKSFVEYIRYDKVFNNTILTISLYETVCLCTEMCCFQISDGSASGGRGGNNICCMLCLGTEGDPLTAWPGGNPEGV